MGNIVPIPMETLEIAHIIVTEQGTLELISWIHLCATKAYEKLKITKQTKFISQ